MVGIGRLIPVHGEFWDPANSMAGSDSVGDLHRLEVERSHCSM